MQALDPVCLGQGLVLCLGAITRITKGGVADMDVRTLGRCEAPLACLCLGFPCASFQFI